MKIDIHRHAVNKDTSIRVVRNLFHSQTGEIESQKFYSVGLHPWHVNEETLQNDIDKVQEIANHPQIIAIGEAGIDKKVDVPYEIQLTAFKLQIAIARQVNKPMIIHCVKAYNEVLELNMTANLPRPWIIHWFNSSGEIAFQLIEKGFYLSYGTMLFREESKAFKLFNKLPLERIFLETDDTGHSLDEIYQKAASLLDIHQKELEQRIMLNFKECFNIEL
jgi:TatD DNase family protein